jgi:predicted alpha/beta-fold hydrolase
MLVLQNAQSTPPSLTEFMSRVKKGLPTRPWLYNGLIATAAAPFKTFLRFKQKKTLKNLKVHKKHFDFFGKTLEYQVKILIKNPSKPTIFTHFGFNGTLDLKANLSLLKGADLFYPDYNIVLIETLSSKHAAARNCFLSLGGVHESYQIRHAIIDFFKSRPSFEKTAIIKGGSTSSFALASAPTLINRSLPNLKIGSFLRSGYNSVYGHIINLNALEKVINGPALYKNSKSLFNFGLKSVAKSRIQLNYDHCPELANESTLIGLIEKSYEQHSINIQTALEDLFQKNNSEILKMEEYYKNLTLVSLLPFQKTPFFWLHANDDPMSSPEQFQEFMFHAKANLKVSGKMTRSGGHSGFVATRGFRFVHCRVKALSLYTQGKFDTPHKCIKKKKD